MRYLLCLFFVISSVLAQPIEGPYQIDWGDFGMEYKSVAIGARGDYLDIFFVSPWDGDLYAAEFSIASRTLTRAPYLLFELPAATRLEIHDPIALDDSRWGFLLYIGREVGANQTSFVFGNHDSFSETVIDTGYADFLHPNSGDSWNATFSLTRRAGGGAIAGWYKALVIVDQPSFKPYYSLLADTGERITRFWIDYATTWTPEWNRPVFRSTISSFFIGAWAASNRSDIVLWGNDPDVMEGYSQTLGNPFDAESVMNFARTSDGGILAVCRTSATPPTLAVGRYDFDEFHFLICNQQYEALMPGDPVDSYWHPDYGFAVLSESDAGLGLARVDTALNEVQPPGDFWQGLDLELHGRDLAVSDDGHVFILWSAENGFSSSLQLAAVEWDAFLPVADARSVTVPSSINLSAAPNPFNSTVQLAYELPVNGDITLSIHNLAGQKVAELVHGFAAAGTYNINWTPDVASGVYFAQLTTPSRALTTKLLYLR